jgi:metal-responsive CopG/Arc/MetJ family transcriptional regulator
MGRKKYDEKDKKSNFGITINPELMKLLEKHSEENGVSKSKMIEDILKQNLKSK